MTTQFRTIAGRWEQLHEPKMASLTAQQRLASRLSYYAGFSDALDAMCELANFPDRDMGILLTAMRTEIANVASVAAMQLAPTGPRQ